MNKLRRNLIYNIIYQILILIIPLITTPYISRVLGPDGIGINSYTYSVVYYFALFGLLGINNYGNRQIAKARGDKSIMSKTFWNIYIIQFIMSIITTILYGLYVIIFSPHYQEIAFIQSLYLISTLLDINWFFFGLEKFKLTVSRNIIIKILSTLFIFLLVKTPSDVWIYTLILASSTLLSQFVLWFYARNELDRPTLIAAEIKNNFKKCLVLFLPVIAISLYKFMDKIMLGNMSEVQVVGYYNQAERIIDIPLGIITALGTVMLPRISNLVSKNDDEKIIKYIDKSMQFMMFLAFPVIFGLIAISQDFITMFLGNDFCHSAYIVDWLCVTILFISFANVLRTQYLIPKEKDNIYVLSVFSGGIVNLIANLILIPKMSAVGASIGTILAEFVVFAIQSFSLRNNLPIKKYFGYAVAYCLKGAVMFVAIMIVTKLLLNEGPPVFRVIAQMSLGSTVYLLLNINYLKSLLFNRKEKK